jgi:two-component system sporulation sensor kinase A
MIIVAVFVTLLFILLILDIEMTNRTLYLIIIPYFIISSMFSYLLHFILENKSYRDQLESEERYKRLVENHPDGILIHEKGIILYTNNTINEMLGYEEGHGIGKSILEFSHPSTHQTIKNRQKEAYSPKTMSQDLIEVELLHKDGSSVFVESKAIVCQYNNKKCVQLVLRDISERKKAEELLIVSDKLAVVGQLAAGIAHEIRNPLTSIKGFMQIMKESTYSSNYYDVILSELDRINQVTNDFLILAKPQAKNLRLYDLQSILQDITTLLRPEAVMHNVDIQLRNEGIETLVLCDVNELKQAFINIIKNSIEAMPTGGTTYIQQVFEEDKIVLTIRDTGVGIPKERMSNIGQPFYTLKEKGTGLGLMTTMRIIENHQGVFQIQSEEGKGTTVTVVFPCP